ncbi:hypothetical protein ACFE04_031272 [Oxalis oulophora]
MAFTPILRKSASSLVQAATKLARGPKYYHSTILTRVNPTNLTHAPAVTRLLPIFNYSTALRNPVADDSLARVIESEIKCAQEAEDHDQVEGVPADFPFKIDDQPGLQTVKLTRDYKGEKIVVEVHMPNLVTGEDDEDLNDNDDDDAQKGNQSSIPLVVTVSKNNAPYMEFTCTAFADEIAIESLAIRKPENSEDQIVYEGPDFNDLDENLQKAFHKYLEMRGIKPSTTNFLHEYMINKDSREYLLWLKNLKGFVEA